MNGLSLKNITMPKRTKIYNVAKGIQIAEGWIVPNNVPPYAYGSSSYIHHNPGNVRSSPFEIENDGAYSYFETDDIGLFAIVWQLWVYAKHGLDAITPNSTIDAAITQYHGGELDTNAQEDYISIVEKVGGVKRTDPVSSLLINN